MNLFIKNLTVKKTLDVPLVGVWSRTIQGEHDLTWQKIAQDPDKHGAIIVRDTLILMGADDKYSHLSLDVAVSQQNKWFAKQGIPERVVAPRPFAMIEFVSYNTNIRKKSKLSKVSINNLEKFASYREQGINQSGKKIKVIRVDGTCKHIRTNTLKGYNKGDRVTIQTGQYYVIDHLTQALDEGYDGVWIISSQYCQRSFTVGKIYIVMLSYDKGDAGRTAQCGSRLASPDKDKDAGLIISNSFDNTRDEKIDLMLNNMAVSRQKKTGLGFHEAVKEVKRGFSIFSLNENGTAIQWEVDEYLYRLATQRTSQEALAVRTITNSIVNAGLVDMFKNAHKATVSSSMPLDNTYLPEEDEDEDNNKPKSPVRKTTKKEENELKKAVQNIVGKSHIICAMGSSEEVVRIGIKQSVQNIINNVDSKEEFMLQFNLDPIYLYDLLDIDSRVEQELDTMVGLNIITTQRRQTEALNEVVWND
jgi:hypothetical protein